MSIKKWWHLLILFIVGWAAIFAIVYYFMQSSKTNSIIPHNECNDGVVIQINADGTSSPVFNELGLPLLCD